MQNPEIAGNEGDATRVARIRETLAKSLFEVIAHFAFEHDVRERLDGRASSKSCHVCIRLRNAKIICVGPDLKMLLRRGHRYEPACQKYQKCSTLHSRSPCSQSLECRKQGWLRLEGGFCFFKLDETVQCRVASVLRGFSRLPGDCQKERQVALQFLRDEKVLLHMLMAMFAEFGGDFPDAITNSEFDKPFLPRNGPAGRYACE